MKVFPLINGMAVRDSTIPGSAPGLAKALTGIDGLDQLTGGGVPAGRPTLICGSAGCGKTLMAATFLVHGAQNLGEPGVLVTFEERATDLEQNVASLGYDLADLQRRGLLAIDHIEIEPIEIEETGEYDLEGLFIRLGFAIDRIGAKRVVLDTLEALFSGFSNEAMLRAELRRLFTWLKDRGVTAIITAERGDGALTRQGLEEYVSDCVILLDHRVEGQVSTRRLRIVKYRGTAHGTNEYPFLIDRHGISVLPVTGLGLDHPASEERVATGIPALDTMMGGQGFFRGSSVLVSGMAGTGKSTICATFVDAACRRGERALYFAFEESPAQIRRNMRSTSLDLAQWEQRGQLVFHASRPTLYGLEMHLAAIHRDVERLRPDVVVIDPMSSLMEIGSGFEVHAMLLRLVDFLKSRSITTLFTNLTQGGAIEARTDAGISSLMDTWLLLLNREAAGEHNRQLYLLKSRGMAHSNQVREFVMSDTGIDLRPAYLGPEGVLTGSARLAQEARDRAARQLRAAEMNRRRRTIARKRAQLLAQMEALQAELELEDEELRLLADEDATVVRMAEEAHKALAQSRRAMQSTEELEDRHGSIRAG